MENELSRALSCADEKIQYDTQCKRVLSQKEILARILARTVKELAGMSTEQILACMEDTPEISSVRVEPGKTNQQNRQSITGLANEDKVQAEGEIYYDIRFYIHIPGEAERIRLIINIEAQKSYYPGYQIVTRGIFYGARMISAQLGTEFRHSQYDDIKKVYSIWVCLQAPQKVGNAIAEYSMEKHDLLPGFADRPEAYDKLSVVVIALNEKMQTEDELTGMLNTLFSQRKTYLEKKQELETKYHIKMSDEFGKEMDRMCNLSDLIEERGIQQGMQQGMQQGIQQGMQRGMQQGSEEKCRDMVRKMLRFALMSDEDILKVAEISQEELERIRKDL